MPNQSYEQHVKSISDFKKFDSITDCNTWYEYKELYSDSIVRYAVKYKLSSSLDDCATCSFGKANCKYIFHESLWRKDGSIEWENRIVAKAFEKIKYKWYTKSGKVAIREKKKYVVR